MAHTVQYRQAAIAILIARPLRYHAGSPAALWDAIAGYNQALDL